MYLVLKDFSHSLDGINSKELKKGSLAEIQKDCVSGLIKEGYIQENSKEHNLEKKIVDVEENQINKIFKTKKKEK